MLFRSEHGVRLSKEDQKILTNLPRNVFLTKLIPDDVYRSALINADVYLSLGYKPAGVITILEAMAAKCQIIAREDTAPSDLLINGKNAYLGKFSETLVSLVTDYLNNQLQPTIETAYSEISMHNLESFGKDLLSIYKQQISLKK